MSKPTMGLRRAGIASVATGALALSGLALGAGAANADADFEFSRLAGDNRYETAGAVYDAYGDNDSIILANGEQGHFPDALVANYLAGVEGSPILLTRSDKMPEATADRLAGGGKTITIVGGEDVVSAEQAAALEAEGHTVERVAGANRYLTAAEVIEEAGDSPSNTAIVTTGVDFPDALAAGPVSVHEGSPIAISRANDIRDEEVDALVASGVTEFIVLGGPTIVGDAVVAELEAAGLDLRDRIFGADRAETSAELANYAIDNFGLVNTGVNVASGYIAGTGADALAGGPLTGEQARPMLITKSNRNAGDGVIAFLTEHANTLTEGIIFGGLGAVDQATEDAMEAAARSVVGNQDVAVSPGEATTLEFIANPDTDTSDDRVYTVSGATAGTEYQIVLAQAANVSTDANGTVTFAEDGASNTADFGTVAADITSVNGVPNGGGQTASITPTGTSFDFRVDGDADETIVPVVYVDADNDGELDLNDNDAPVDAEAFGVGGEINYQPGEAGEGTIPADVKITEVDKDANQFIAGDLYNYDANDTFFIDENDNDTAETGEQVTLSQFEAELSVNDELDGEFYQTNPELSSEFLLQDLAPSAPTFESVTEVTDTTATANLSGVLADANSVTVYCDGDSEASSDSEVCGTASTDADDDAANFQVNVTGLQPGTTYDFVATQTVDGEESEVSAEEVEATTDTTESTIAPTIDDAQLVVDNFVVGAVDDSDEATVTFSEAVTQVAQSGGAPDEVALIDLTDPDGDLIRVRCGYPANPDGFMVTGDGITEALCAFAAGSGNQTIEVALQEPAEDRNVAGDAGSPGGSVSWPLTIIDIANVIDADGNEVDLENSDDLLVENE